MRSGASYSIAGGRLQASYNFERRNFASLDEFITPGGNLILLNTWKMSMHYASVDAKILEKKGFGWRSGLRATIWKSKPDNATFDYLPETGDHYASGGGGAVASSVTGWRVLPRWRYTLTDEAYRRAIMER